MYNLVAHRNVSRVFCVCRFNANRMHHAPVHGYSHYIIRLHTLCRHGGFIVINRIPNVNFLTKKQVVQYAIQESVKIDHETMRSFNFGSMFTWSLNINHVNFIFLHCENLHWRKLGRRVMQKCICMSSVRPI